MSDSTDNWKLYPLGYSEFLTMFVDEIPPSGKDWPTIGFSIKDTGIWVTPEEIALGTIEELASWNVHPENNPKIPALPFPCDYNQANRFFSWLKYIFVDFEITGLDEDWKKEYANYLSWQPVSDSQKPDIGSYYTKTTYPALILKTIKELGHDPLKLHVGIGKTTGTKGLVWKKIEAEFKSKATFDGYWKTMKKSGDLRDELSIEP